MITLFHSNLAAFETQGLESTLSRMLLRLLTPEGQPFYTNNTEYDFTPNKIERPAQGTAEKSIVYFSSTVQ